jgi:hypothetical protein
LNPHAVGIVFNEPAVRRAGVWEKAGHGGLLWGGRP